MRTWIFCFGKCCFPSARCKPRTTLCWQEWYTPIQTRLKRVEEPGRRWCWCRPLVISGWKEVEGTTNLQREFNNYLDSFRSIVVYAAQVYGFYHEIDRLVDNLGGFTKQLDKHPSNALAVALSAKRNKIYQELIMGSVEIVNDIRLVCLSGNKMTEKEQWKSFSASVPKLKVMNKSCNGWPRRWSTPRWRTSGQR